MYDDTYYDTYYDTYVDMNRSRSRSPVLNEVRDQKMPGGNEDNPLLVSPSPPVIAHVAIKPPVFTTKDPELFFLSMESQFHTRDVTVSLTKFHYVITMSPRHSLKRSSSR